ncbi:hypothetical protein SPRG_22234 [Saprolegnia parasitica CBS 223.65]|uniref:Uncharacterized protein n=1 Tax=Saprolegnia parasitica (strain CBS 223.65) TaxID=695850 RepID=A0A067C9E5_SAPPC|nr:hypothetical protein SPRG_22234 [Saprolegnia parasitica CBS 223.65]KDO25770.1 hypothetical protein SPRG_22234 [Saprolegnia parasitica CBS 223.65]|eukprot:XP_012203606.1 hypothetical protein SPRG_22234 [Saprolegnia parasitica CBS 223.65]
MGATTTAPTVLLQDVAPAAHNPPPTIKVSEANVDVPIEGASSVQRPRPRQHATTARRTDAWSPDHRRIDKALASGAARHPTAALNPVDGSGHATAGYVACVSVKALSQGDRGCTRGSPRVLDDGRDKKMSKEDEDVVLTLLTKLTKMKISVDTLDVSTALKAMVEVSLRDVGSLLPKDTHDLVVLPYNEARAQMVLPIDLPTLPLGHCAAFVGQGKLELAPGIDPTRFIAIGGVQLDILLAGKHRLKKWKRDVQKLLEASAAIPVDPPRLGQPTTPQRIVGNPYIMASPSPRRIGGRLMTSPSARSLPSRSPQLIEFILPPSPVSSPANTKAGARLQAVVELDPIEAMKTAFNDAKTPKTLKTQKSSTQTRHFFFQVLLSKAFKLSSKMSTKETYKKHFTALLVAEAQAAIIAGYHN